jgi:8-oxo-dGTP pyrophosphatase MutT (NUDIX family)/phosphohistidine phosphatase SixA
MPQEGARADVVAAGAVVLRRGQQVLLVHRPRYDDWAFPKGKLDRGEAPAVAAVREVAEETGLHIRLGPPLGDHRYLVAGGRWKLVHYWVGRVVGDDDVSGYQVNDEIDDVEWVPVDKAAVMLTYEYDRQTLAEARRRRKKTKALLVLRHAEARARKSWRRDDRERPLLKLGELQAQRLVPLLAAYDVTTIASSSSVRCRQTVAPYTDMTGFELGSFDGLSEEKATPDLVVAVVQDLLDADAGTVLCTHRPVLPMVFEALGMEPFTLEPGELLVVQHRRGSVVSVERHRT